MNPTEAAELQQKEDNISAALPEYKSIHTDVDASDQMIRGHT